MGKGGRAADAPLEGVPHDGAVDFLYHYTGEGFIDDILEDCILRPSRAAWGFGVYLTDIPPRSDNRRRISKAFGRRRFYAERLEAYVRIERDKADADQHPDDPHVFIAPGKVSIAGAPVEVGMWQGGGDPDDTAGWRAVEFARCAPNIDELRAAFERLRPGPRD